MPVMPLRDRHRLSLRIAPPARGWNRSMTVSVAASRCRFK
jgi:hypothetical protein